MNYIFYNYKYCNLVRFYGCQSNVMEPAVAGDIIGRAAAAHRLTLWLCHLFKATIITGKGLACSQGHSHHLGSSQYFMQFNRQGNSLLASSNINGLIHPGGESRSLCVTPDCQSATGPFTSTPARQTDSLACLVWSTGG